MTLNFNEAGEQRSFDLVPDRTIVAVQMRIRPGGAGEDGMLRRSKAGTSEALDVEFTVLDGPFAKRKFWEALLVSGTTQGHQSAADITRRKLRAIIESARGIMPNDQREAAVQARNLSSYTDLDGLCFLVRVGVEPARGEYKAKNVLKEIVTPNKTEWKQLEQVKLETPPAAAVTTATETAVPRPAWAIAS
jgi:hypothetical protein